MIRRKAQPSASSFLRAPRMKKTAGTARARSKATIDGFNQPGRKRDVTPIEASEIPGTRAASKNGHAVERRHACQLQCRCWKPSTRGISPSAKSRTTKDASISIDYRGGRRGKTKHLKQNLRVLCVLRGQFPGSS